MPSPLFQTNQDYIDLFKIDRRGGIELIHKRHKQYCIDFLLQYYPVREDIEEIYHDGILVLHDKLLDPSFQLTCSIQTYLNTICKNQLFKKINRQKEFSSLPDEFDCDDWFDDEQTQGPGFDRELEVLRDELAKLARRGSKCYDLFQLVYFEKYSMEEVTDLLDYGTSGNTRNQKYRCLQRLKEHINRTLGSN